MRSVYKSSLVAKVWGREEHIVNNDEYCGKRLILREGFRCSIHRHHKKHETFYVDRGRVLLEYQAVGAWDGVGCPPLETHVMTEWDCFEIERGMYHRFTGLEPSVILEFSTPDSPEDSERITQSQPVPEDEWEQLGRWYGKLV